MRASTNSSRLLLRAVALGALLGATLLGCSSDDDGDRSSRPTSSAAGSVARPAKCGPTIDAASVADADELADLVAALQRFGPRMPGSDAHEAAMDWLVDQFSAIPGMTVTEQTYPMQRWLPTTELPGAAPGKDLAAAGSLRIDGAAVPVAGAVPFSLPSSGTSTPLVVVSGDDEITAEHVAGRIVVRTVDHVSIPYSVFPVIAHHLTADMPGDGDYDRPYLRDTDTTLTLAGIAGAAGVVLLFDVPNDQISGYWQPHTGTRYHVPAVFVGSDQAGKVTTAAEAGATGEVVVKAEWSAHTARNIIATLRGKSRERIVVNSHTDGTTWVQENGTAGALALARSFGALDETCRARDVQFALTANHLGYTADGTFPYGEQLDADYDSGTVAFVLAMEHLGAREVLPDTDGTLVATGKTDMFAWVAPQESKPMVDTSIAAVKRRRLPRTAVLKGVAAPTDTLPQFCSQGGLGTNFNGLLIPSIGTISGPWTLWTDVLGRDAFDPALMRRQVLAIGDVIRTLDGVGHDEIAGDYPDLRRRRAAGERVCDLPHPPAVAPTG